MARDALEATGLEVIEAEDGASALRTFDERSPDLVILDVHMPGRDGLAACREMRARPAGAEIPILMVTASDDLHAIRSAYEFGATDFTMKPVNWMILSQRIRYMLRMSDALGELQRSQRRLTRAQRMIGLGTWELDLASKRIFFSEELGRLYGLSSMERELDFAVLLSLINPDDRDTVRCAVERAVAEASSLSVQHRLALKNGGERILHLQADALLDEDGKPRELSGTVLDITQLRKAEDEVQFLAYHDGLTGLGNRRLFAEHLNRVLAQARRNHSMVAVLLIDLDHFKRINDTFGHSVGDLFLQNAAERLKSCVRESDFVSRATHQDAGAALSRFGGDEFMVALSGLSDLKEIGHVSERILESLARPFEIDGQEIVVTGSIGIALWPANGADVEELLRNADAAVYSAKESGRSCYEFYDRSMNAVAEKNLRLESELRSALERGGLEVHYQPKMDLGTGKITGFEALARWKHPEFGPIPPDRFIPLAEQAGLISQLGDYVLREACNQGKAWKESGLAPVRIAVNLSAYQFRTDELAEVVTRIIEETPIDPKQLDLEITESAMMQNQAVTVRVLSRLKGIGVTVSLDDFGTGYSSLGYLKGFPVDSVKIDRSFIQEITSNSEDAALTAAIISMAQALSLRVVAEGVETEEQLELLRAQGCEEAQGYLFSRPLTAEAATAFLRDNLAAKGPYTPS